MTSHVTLSRDRFMASLADLDLDFASVMAGYFEF